MMVRGHRKDGKWDWWTFKPMPKEPELTVMVLVKEGNYVIYMDGKEVRRFPTGRSHLAGLELGSSTDLVVLEEVKLRKIE